MPDSTPTITDPEVRALAISILNNPLPQPTPAKGEVAAGGRVRPPGGTLPPPLPTPRTT